MADKLKELAKKLDREKFTEKRLIKVNCNQGKFSRGYEYPEKAEIK